ncbi:MAG: galactose-1-phosphate uridylyltransferase [Candidatus Binatia bacterium]
MPKLRQDPTTKEWVIFATERAKRPDDFIRRTSDFTKETQVSTCPFCPGNEASTPPAVLTLPGEKSQEWSVRVVPNKFAALVPGRTSGQMRVSNIFQEMEGVGFHEVIIETPEHDKTLALMQEERVLDVLKAYKQRYESLRQESRVKLILIFKNHGETAGTSLEHPHSQLVAAPVVPEGMRQRYEVATAYFDDTGRCIHCDLVEDEIELKERIVLETDRFIVFHPFASRFPFETWIAPKRHQPSFANIPDKDLKELAQVLKSILLGLFTALENPDYNYVIHSAPVEDEQKSYYLWHIQIIPRLTKIAGFELGSGMSINTVLPEETAKFIRGR